MEHAYLVLMAVLAVANTANAEATDAIDVCGDEITMPAVKSTKLRFDGHMLQRNSDCQIKFTLTDTDQYKICVLPLNLNLNCGTRILYQKFFVAESLHDGELTCSMNHQSQYEGECFPYVSTFFIVFEKDDTYVDTSESAYIHIYAEETPSFSIGITSNSTWMIAMFVTIPMIVVVVCLICYKIRQQRNQQYTNTQITYNTTVGSTTIPTGGGPQYPVAPNQQAYPQPVNQPLMAPSNPGQDSMAGYYVHPTVTAYPAQNPAAPGAYNYQPVHQSHGAGMQPPLSGPPPNSFAAPPPSYDSVMNKEPAVV